MTVAYRDFDFEGVVTRFDLAVRERELFPDLPTAAPDPAFAVGLAAGIDLAKRSGTVKARSEFAVAPTLLELVRLAPRRFGLFSGNAFDVDPAAGLYGHCGFLVTRWDPLAYRVAAPVLLTVTEARTGLFEDLGRGVAEAVAAQRLNDRSGADSPVYGAVTSGSHWQFLRLDARTLTVDTDVATDPGKILAVLLHIVGGA